MKNEIKSAFGDIPLYGKLIILLIVGVLVYFAIIKINAHIKATKNHEENKAEITVLQSQGVQQSFSDSMYANMADDLETAMRGWGTDETAVFEVFSKLKNDVDFIKLQSAFSIRDDEDLYGWLNGDLSSYDKKKINNLLATKNITKRI